MQKASTPGSKKRTVLKKGSTSVTIYYTPNKGVDQYTLTYYIGKVRKRRKYSDFTQAKTEGERVLEKLSTGDFEALRLSGEDRSIYVHAKRLLDSQMPGVSLLQAIEEYVSAKSLLPANVNLVEPCRDYAEKRIYPEKLPEEVMAELIESKKGLSVSEVYLKDLRRLNRFSEAFKCPILSIKSAQIEQFLDNLNMTPRTRNNYRRNLVTLFQFAQQRGYLPKDHTIMDGVGRARESDQEVKVFTPRELQSILQHARKDMLPYFAIAAFAGLRTAEIQRLEWNEIDLDEGHIEVKSTKSKTASRRLVPMSENLRKWLEMAPSKDGRIIEIQNVAKQIKQLVDKINDVEKASQSTPRFAWKHNGLRHSYISYRLAELKDAAQVAYEAGNSPQVVFKNYRKVVTERESKQWFSINPQQFI